MADARLCDSLQSPPASKINLSVSTFCFVIAGKTAEDFPAEKFAPPCRSNFVISTEAAAM